MHHIVIYPIGNPIEHCSLHLRDQEADMVGGASNFIASQSADPLIVDQIAHDVSYSVCGLIKLFVE